VKLDRPETTVVTSLGICFAFALLAQEFGYSVALGAFLAGSLVAESGEEKTVEHLIRPVRDVFAAIFFVSVGMLIEPSLVREYAGAIAVLTVVVVVGKFVGVTLGGFLTGNGTRTSVQAGMSLAQIGEFSFIIAGLGLSLNATGKFLYPIAVTVSAVTTLTTPWLIRASGPVASFIDRKLPRPLQTFVALYGSWVERVRTSPPSRSPGASFGRLLKWLVLDAALLTMLLIGTSVALDSLAAWLEHSFEVDPEGARLAVMLCAGLLSVPFCIGIVRLARKAGVVLAERALPATTSGTVDFAAAPRRAFVVTLQLGCVLLVGIPMLALTQPFLPGFQGAAVLAVLIAVLAVGFWRSATNLQGHVQAGAQAIIEVLAAQSKSAPDTMTEVKTLLPGIGEPAALRLAPDSPAVGKTLAELNLRGLTGATVLAVRREDESVIVPTALERLRADDVLALAGTTEAIEAARGVLTGKEKGPQVFGT